MENNILPKIKTAWNKGLTKSDPRVQKMYSNRNSWNKGLTKETDARVKQAATAIQQSWNPTNIAHRTESYRNNMMANHGVLNAFQLTSIKEKSRQTCLKKYGVDNFSKSSEYIVKSKKTKLEKYGDENYTNTEKSKQTCLKRYGVTNQNKIKNVRDKIKQTCLEKYGVDNPSKTIESIEKAKQTCLLRYGVASIMHCPSFVEKQEHNAFRSKKYTLPSGKIISCQGYEPFAMDTLLKEFNENDIVIGRKEIPKFWYNTTDNKKHIYYPDIFVKSINTIVEVKSTWTNTLHPIIDNLKQQAVLNEGYKFKKMIFNNAGTLIL